MGVPMVTALKVHSTVSVDYDHDVGQYMGIDGLTASSCMVVKNFEGTANDPYSYSDFLVGIDKEVKGFKCWCITCHNQSIQIHMGYNGKYLGETRNVFYVAKEF